MSRVIQDTATIAWDISTAGQGSGSVVDDSITNAKLAEVATATIKGRSTAGTGNPEDLTGTQATALLDAFTGDSGSGGVKGLVPAPAAGDAAGGKFLKADATWATTMSGSTGGTDNAILRANGAGGGTVQGSEPLIDDDGHITPGTDDGSGLGTALLKFADLFLASGGVVNWDNGDVTVTHSANTLTFAGASSGYVFSHALLPSANDGAALGASGTAWSDAFFASGAVLNFNAGNYTITHSAGDLAFNGTITLPNAGLHILDTNASHDLIIAAGSDLTGDHTLTLTTGDADRTLTISGDHTLPAGTSVVTAGGQTITGGYAITPYNAGTKSTGTYTPASADGNYQYATNGGAHTLAAPANDCAIDILYTNNGSAGSITFSGFTVGSSTGSALNTTNTNKFLISIRRINSVATYSIYALQ